MNGLKQVSMVEFTDRFLQTTAVSMLLVAIAYGLSAVSFVVSEDVAEILNMLETGLGILVLVILLPMFLFMLRKLTSGQRRRCFESEGYVAYVFKRACVKAFEFTFITLIAMDFITGKYVTELPADFFIKTTLALSLTVFGTVFFYLNRGNGGGEAEEERLA